MIPPKMKSQLMLLVIVGTKCKQSISFCDSNDFKLLTTIRRAALILLLFATIHIFIFGKCLVHKQIQDPKPQSIDFNHNLRQGKSIWLNSIANLTCILNTRVLLVPSPQFITLSPGREFHYCSASLLVSSSSITASGETGVGVRRDRCMSRY